MSERELVGRCMECNNDIIKEDERIINWIYRNLNGGAYHILVGTLVKGVPRDVICRELGITRERGRQVFKRVLRMIGTQMGVKSSNQVAKKSRLGCESLYKTLSKKGNPKLSTLIAVLSSLGFGLRVKSIDTKKEIKGIK